MASNKHRQGKQTRRGAGGRAGKSRQTAKNEDENAMAKVISSRAAFDGLTPDPMAVNRSKSKRWSQLERKTRALAVRSVIRPPSGGRDRSGRGDVLDGHGAETRRHDMTRGRKRRAR
ncbi:hypothetical protein JDV02_010863 [Purpureocillium takamizusanense]|uniref:Uncharacterized protein n=1 Tax=Purpureocillium takamizusanense TaxID=2060973 RepID=A0A9Q8QKA9_9HYPO|nr:uncharacterized protein JDV02_010863 [Purpureocillium takamizusanense]UNI20741.1 hypothetical protein JDV02_010863 [Purpureocillium takamizusanense]